MKTRELISSWFLLLLVAYSRFLSMAGLDVHWHLKVLGAYFYTESRASIFIIQYAAIFYLAFECKSKTPPTSAKLVLACVLLMLVSLARYHLPIFLISCLGDALVMWWFAASKKKTNQLYCDSCRDYKKIRHTFNIWIGAAEYQLMGVLHTIFEVCRRDNKRELELYLRQLESLHNNAQLPGRIIVKHWQCPKCHAENFVGTVAIIKDKRWKNLDQLKFDTSYEGEPKLEKKGHKSPG